MNKNYMIYPMKYMRITQNYLGGTSHLKHTTGYPKDYPIDEAGKDTGRDAIHCPCDEMIVTAIKGYGNSKVTNTLWLVSTSAVVTPSFEDFAFVTFTHENDSDLKKLKVGDTFHRGDIICYEGTDGATANHIHIVAGRGRSSNWEKNTTGAWVISGDTKKPEEVFFVDPSFTTILSSGGLSFKNLEIEKVGVPIPRNSGVNQLEVVVDNLRAREVPNRSGNSLGYIKKGIYNYSDVIEADGYSWYHVENFWIAYNDSWIHLYPKQEEEKPPVPIPDGDGGEGTDENTDKDQDKDDSVNPILPRLIFTSKESKYYKIYLKENSKLYFKDS